MWDANSGANSTSWITASARDVRGELSDDPREEFRQFDPNQGNYTLEGSGSVRAGPIEVAGVFHHVSRHLSDRPKRFPVDWNMIGGRIRAATARGRSELRDAWTSGA